MKDQCQRLYDAMLSEMEQCRQQHTSEKEQIECAFRTCEMNWKKLQTLLHTYRFQSEAEEAWFFKTIKPKFTGLIEYYALVYKAALFLPDDDARDINRFWQNELQLARRFFAEHETFYKYYKAGLTEMDTIYFVRANNDPTLVPAAKAYDIAPEATTSHDHLVASIIARERYMEYVQRQLQRMTN
ncbi:RteC domain-containing protein [Paraflavitalea sp. CAU 1676]|uniref:RteC domain-containing protein n=1 Tax=Paraflavitalea sp. CAU 1676 TaxID=3032598 RepID=UPI0023DAB957|nr:RteC domain-containing protein [Paraflavitalea sp. CAU 1676]MDF2192268.1 RteC domain-containing protein [Paraflavitalea sp. CAU 1676]